MKYINPQNQEIQGIRRRHIYIVHQSEIAEPQRQREYLKSSEREKTDYFIFKGVTDNLQLRNNSIQKTMYDIFNVLREK